MTEPARKLMSLEEFLAWDDGTDGRYELVDGVIVAMAPPAPAHSAIVANLVAELRSRLPSSCISLVEAGVVLPWRPNTFYVADLVVTCRALDPSRTSVDQPMLVFEVLSPTTEAHDRGVKLPDYVRLPSVEGVVLVHSTERRVQLWARELDHWAVRDLIADAELAVPRLSSTIPMSAVYANVPL